MKNLKKRKVGAMKRFGKFWTVQCPKARVIFYDKSEAENVSRELKAIFK